MEENILVTGEPLSKGKFKTPSKEFGIMPFWFWNGEMSYDEIAYQIREYKAKGCKCQKFSVLVLFILESCLFPWND